jgi:hypothetical protein
VNKTCTACGKTKPKTEFATYRNRQKEIRLRGQCKACHNEAHARRLNNPAARQKKRTRDNKWRANNPDKVAEYIAQQADNRKRYHRKQCDEVTDRYILNRLHATVSDAVPVELIEAKRLQILIGRLLQEQGHEKRSRTSGRFS